MTAQLIATHPRPVLVAALLVLICTLVACDEGVDVAVIGIPDDATVSVDTLRWDTAAIPSKVYRYKGIGSAKLLGVPPAPSYTAVARRLDGCVVAAGTAENSGGDDVVIYLHPVVGCAASTTPSLPDMGTPSADMRSDIRSDMASPWPVSQPVDMAARPADMQAPTPVCAPIAQLPAPIAVGLAPSSCATPVRWSVDCKLHCPPEGAGSVYESFYWMLKSDPKGYTMFRTFYATNASQDVSNLAVGDVLEFAKCSGQTSHTFFNVVKQQLNPADHGVAVLGGGTPQCPGYLNGTLAPWKSPPVSFYRASF